MSIYQRISQLVSKGIDVRLINQLDAVYVQNQLLDILNLSDFKQLPLEATSKTIPDLIEELIQYAIEQKVIDDVLGDREILAAKIMNCFVSKPSVVHKHFYSLYEQSPEQATNYFYELSKNSNYIQMKRINKNIHYRADSPYGELDITINLSKPEKDPEQIKREREQKQASNYPLCVLCAENEGYVGRIGYPARANHRVIHVPLEGENWYLQYSPYVYYNEHSIILAEEHRPMKIDRSTFKRLLAFVEKFPHYFIGSNADLPIVGGSILSHDHYQGGRYEFAMTKARHAFSFRLDKFEDVDATVIHWPLAVIRMKSENKNQLIDAATHILHVWKEYSDPAADILAYTEETPHNTITPIARKRGSIFEMDLVLRNNRTTKQHPLGIFHPHEDVHHIKKENIGLIEVMGLAVLPARLKEELSQIKNYLLNESAQVADYHKQWAEQIKQTYNTNKMNNSVEQILHHELGKKFTKVLEDAGVFKTDPRGQEAFKVFIETVNKRR